MRSRLSQQHWGRHDVLGLRPAGLQEEGVLPSLRGKGKGGGSMTEGRHVLGHIVLESWEALAKGGQETALMPTPEIIQRATRDIKLLVGLLDADVGMMADMGRAYGLSADRGLDWPPALDSKGSTSIWPAEPFQTLGAFAKWVMAHFGIPVSTILKETGKRAAAQLTIAEAKSAVERILAARAAKA